MTDLTSRSITSYLNGLPSKVSFCHHPFCLAAEKIESVKVQLAASSLLPVDTGGVQLTPCDKAGTPSQPALHARRTAAAIPLVRAQHAAGLQGVMLMGSLRCRAAPCSASAAPNCVLLEMGDAHYKPLHSRAMWSNTQPGREMDDRDPLPPFFLTSSSFKNITGASLSSQDSEAASGADVLVLRSKS